MVDEGLDREGDRWVAENVKRLREQRSWSQSELARRMVAAGATNYNQMTVSRTEKGERTVSVGELLILAKVLETFVIDLLQSPPANDIVELSYAVQNKIQSIKEGMEELYELQLTLALKADSYPFGKTLPPFERVIEGLVTTTPDEIVEDVKADRAEKIEIDRLRDDKRLKREDPIAELEHEKGPFVTAMMEVYGVLDPEAS
ncbi:helix-turn-helix domain-containing protein [Brevibacterium sp. R8603A2]|uniref:helix-turn-helix transcriptional regulator n=1 Tax=Brevibacterium sp. R8603A2 TaxID=2929779 RepID=UPI001FF72EFE|nr:helix-turn-helix transcriptional regulator [Brevibacterium sp. R8603A2]MCK1804080.1 helix-turn-helix domain-containing protein [Brevibacterium sp. R8603A2]